MPFKPNSEQTFHPGEVKSLVSMGRLIDQVTLRTTMIINLIMSDHMYLEGITKVKEAGVVTWVKMIDVSKLVVVLDIGSLVI